MRSWGFSKKNKERIRHGSKCGKANYAQPDRRSSSLRDLDEKNPYRNHYEDVGGGGSPSIRRTRVFCGRSADGPIKSLAGSNGVQLLGRFHHESQPILALHGKGVDRKQTS